MLMAIAARFGLELRQFDVANAFVHALIDRLVYMRMPRGYARQGMILQLDKALYGLRISPLLWQKDITKYLTSMGFLPVPHEPCCMIRNGLFIFFYIDDIIRHQLWTHPARLLQRLWHPKTIRIHLSTLQTKLSSVPTASRLVVEECSQVQICCFSCSEFSCSRTDLPRHRRI